MSDYGSFRFGWDSPARITGTTVLLQESTELLPGEPMVYAPIPFTPVSASSSTPPLTADGYPLWQNTPSRVDLIFYQGDDVILPLYFNDPDLTGDDMSSLEWFAEIRVIHSYRSTLVGRFSIAAVYHPDSNPADEIDDEYTKVELFLPREDNANCG